MTPLELESVLNTTQTYQQYEFYYSLYHYVVFLVGMVLIASICLFALKVLLHVLCRPRIRRNSEFWYLVIHLLCISFAYSIINVLWQPVLLTRTLGGYSVGLLKYFGPRGYLLGSWLRLYLVQWTGFAVFILLFFQVVFCLFVYNQSKEFVRVTNALVSAKTFEMQRQFCRMFLLRLCLMIVFLFIPNFILQLRTFIDLKGIQMGIIGFMALHCPLQALITIKEMPEWKKVAQVVNNVKKSGTLPDPTPKTTTIRMPIDKKAQIGKSLFDIQWLLNKLNETCDEYKTKDSELKEVDVNVISEGMGYMSTVYKCVLEFDDGEKLAYCLKASF
ncbi:hypothetical protein M3Y97_01126400 [Aphelenchoides bicaudatus]|nr:hypothetical protein M3Y97_01126400 [Aphelenchoides bicaudatus]